jgi:hypothetical protein
LEKTDKSPTPFSNAILLTLLLWCWVFPAAFFWNLAKQSGILLPNLPQSVWFLPGELWQRSPIVYVVAVVISPFVCYFISLKRQLRTKPIRLFSVIIFALITVINLLWGVTIYQNLF